MEVDSSTMFEFILTLELRVLTPLPESEQKFFLQVQYIYLISALVDRTSVNDWLYK